MIEEVLFDFTSGIAGVFLTVAGTIFVAELTDKDAFLLLALATNRNPWVIFAAGSIAFTITSAIIVLLGSALVLYVPVVWIKIAGGVVMLAYALWEFARGLKSERDLKTGEERFVRRGQGRRLYVFLLMVSSLVALDLAGDATEVLTLVFVAQFQDILLVFVGAVVALVGASAVETMLGNRLGRILSPRRVRYISIVVFTAIGAITITTVAVGV